MQNIPFVNTRPLILCFRQGRKDHDYSPSNPPASLDLKNQSTVVLENAVTKLCVLSACVNTAVDSLLQLESYKG